MIEHASHKYLEDAKFQSILVACIERLERGESLDRERLLAEHSEFADPLVQFLDDQALLKEVANGVRDSLGDSPANNLSDNLLFPLAGRAIGGEGSSERF